MPEALAQTEPFSPKLAVFALHCTKKVLDRIPGSVEEPEACTTTLGNWYVNILFSRPQVLLLVSEQTLLPVVIGAATLKSMVPRFAEQLAFVLHDLGVPKEDIISELREMMDFRICKTQSRKLLGHVNDYMYHLESALVDDRLPTFEHISLRLAETPINSHGFRNAAEMTRERFCR